MKFEAEVKVDIDLQELFDALTYKDQEHFMEANITSASNDTLIQELVSRGFEVTKG